MWNSFRVDTTAEVQMRQQEIGLLDGYPIKGRAWLLFFESRHLFDSSLLPKLTPPIMALSETFVESASN